MKNIDVLRGRHEEIEAELRSIHSEAGDRSLDEQETARWDELETELRQVQRDISDTEAEMARAERVAESRAKWGSLQVARPAWTRSPTSTSSTVWPTTTRR